MKLLTIIYDRSIGDGITDILREHDVPGYTKILGAQGFGGTGLKMGTPIWPGTNNILLIALEESKIDSLVHDIREYQSTFRQKPGITLLTQPVEMK